MKLFSVAKKLTVIILIDTLKTRLWLIFWCDTSAVYIRNQQLGILLT